MVSICCVTIITCVEQIVRSKWRVYRLQVTCHAESGCLECGCADDDKSGASAMFPTAPSCIYQITCLRAVAPYR